METYTGFAEVYDEMMDNIPYLEWENFLLQLLFLNNVKPDAIIAEIGCGTGTMTELLADEGFKMSGVDLSEDMLRLAREKCPDISFKQMDMRELVLDEPQDVIISIADSMNYLETVDDLSKTMKGVYNALVPGGVFIFDLKTEFFFKYVVRNRTFRGHGNGFSYVWKNYYDEDAKCHTYDVTIKLKTQRYKNKDKDIIEIENINKFIHNEKHKQYVFTAQDIKKAAIYGGFRGAKVYGNMTFEKPRLNDERIYVVLTKEK